MSDGHKPDRPAPMSMYSSAAKRRRMDHRPQEQKSDSEMGSAEQPSLAPAEGSRTDEGPQEQKLDDMGSAEPTDPPSQTSGQQGGNPPIWAVKLQKSLDGLTGQINGLDKKVDGLDKKVDGLDKKVDVVKNEVEILNAVTPLAWLNRWEYHVVGQEDEIVRAIQFGGIATWTVVKCGSELLVVGSKHCALYYKTVTRGVTFVSLPKAVVEKGVVAVYYPDDINSERVEHDFFCVEVGSAPSQFSEDADFVEYEAWDPANIQAQVYPIVFGKSLGGPVIGKNACIKEGGVIFVEDQGEPGNSGTVMFIPRDVQKPAEGRRMVGVYWGIQRLDPRLRARDENRDLELRARGVIVPVPPRDSLKRKEPMDSDAKNLVVHDTKGRRRPLSKVSGSGGASYYALKDGDDDCYGILLEGDITYRGYKGRGSCRSIG